MYQLRRNPVGLKISTEMMRCRTIVTRFIIFSTLLSLIGFLWLIIDILPQHAYHQIMDSNVRSILPGVIHDVIKEPPPSCEQGQPCEYADVVDLRILVLTFNRPESLNKCLHHVAELDTLGDRVSVEIWIDRAKDGTINEDSVRIAEHFCDTWSRGSACVHLQEKNANIMGQWVNAWRPRADSMEMGLFLEDDVDISRHSYRWLKAVHAKYHNLTDLAGYSLQTENVQFIRGNMAAAHGPKEDTVFMHYTLNTWGMVPRAQVWRQFQDWFYEARKNKTFHPYIRNTMLFRWYTGFENQGTQDSMWEMWPIYYTYNRGLHQINSNLPLFTGRKDMQLSANRKEDGLHFHGSAVDDSDQKLLKDWDPNFVIFPEKIARYDLDGTLMRRG